LSDCPPNDILQILDDKKPKFFPRVSKIKVQCGLKYSQNVKKVAFHQGLDHFNSPKVPHNDCKGATKEAKSK
jgi:hypothetical protein